MPRVSPFSLVFSRNFMKKYKLLFLFLFLSRIAFLQPLSAVYQWESFISYNNATALAYNHPFLYTANELSVSVAQVDDNSIQILNKITGLSDMGVSTIAYNKSYKTLIIAYTNGNLDFVKDNGLVINRPAIMENTNITGDKSIKHIYCDSNFVYFSTDFGIVTYDMDLNEFERSAFTPNVNVRSSCIFHNKIYISTSRGIYYIDIQDNILDFNRWSRMDITDGLPVSIYHSSAISTLGVDLYADVNDTIMKFDGVSWNHIQTIYSNTGDTLPYCYTFYPIKKFQTSVNNDLLCISGGFNFGYLLDSRGFLNVLYFDPQTFGNVNDVILDVYYNPWTAHTVGLHKNIPSGPVKIALSGPAQNKISDMLVSPQGTLWCTGAIRSLVGPIFDRVGGYKYKNRIWTNYNEKTFSQLSTVYDINSIAIHPKNETAYIGSLMSGLLVISPTDSIQIIDKNTAGSLLEFASGNNGVTRVSGVAFDEDQNLWMTNNITLKPIVVLKKDGSWASFSYNYAEFSYLTVDRYGNKWILRRDGQITVYDSGDDIDLTSDDRFLVLNTSNSQLGGNAISLTKDREGAIWIGTTNGVTIFNCNVMDGNCPGNRPVVNPDNFNGRLMEAEIIRSMSVDGANRKWIGTDNGVFLIDPDTYEQIHFFNEENSPLFSNKVYRVAVDGMSGMVYIATEKGLQGYRAEATKGVLAMSQDQVVVFPNPVMPDYEGPISIKNLVEDANVKITDLSGNLVFEQKSFGGQAVWDGRNYLGQEAKAGVYLVFVVNEDGTQTLVTKFVLIR